MTKEEEAKFDEQVAFHNGKNDICPVMSIGRKTPASCVKHCAWFDEEQNKCVISRINANLKWLENIAK